MSTDPPTTEEILANIEAEIRALSEQILDAYHLAHSLEGKRGAMQARWVDVRAQAHIKAASE